MKKIILSFLGLFLIFGLVGAVSAADGDELNVPQHTWAPGHASNSNSTIQMKWGLAAGAYDGYAVTICDSTWTSINGETGYIDYSCHAHGQFFCIWENDNQTGDIAPTTAEILSPPSTSPGYLSGAAGGRLLEGHVSCPPPPVCGNGIVEGGTPMFPAEECDDSNVANGDGCSDTCQIENKIAAIQHIWATHHVTNTGSTPYVKFGCNKLPDPDKCYQYGATRPVTICGTSWPNLNGQLAYLENTGGEYFYAWANSGLTTVIPDPAGSFVVVPPFEAGRLSGSPYAGYILDGDRLCLGEVPPDTTAPLVTIDSPDDGDVVCGVVDIYGTIIEDTELSHYNISVYPGDADFNNFSLRLEQSTVYRSTGFDSELIYQWDTTGYDDGEYLIRLAARDKAGNRDRSGDPYLGGDDSQHVIRVTVGNNTKAGLLMCRGVSGKGLENALGLQKPFNPKSKADEHAGKK